MNSLFCNPISGIWLQKDCLAVGLFLVWHGMKRNRPKFIPGWLADASVWHSSFWTKWQSLYLSFVSNCLSAKRILFHCLFRGIDFYWYVSCKNSVCVHKVSVYNKCYLLGKKTCFYSFKHHLNYSCLFSQRQHQPLDTGGVISQDGDSMQ